MSHITTFKTIIKDIDLLKTICTEKGYQFEISEVKETEEISVIFFGNKKKNGVMKIKLNKWYYPILIDKEGLLLYDNFMSAPNSMEILGSLIQEYNKRAVINQIEFDKFGNVTINEEKNGDIVIELVNY